MLIQGNKWVVKFSKILNWGQWGLFSENQRTEVVHIQSIFEVAKYLSSICAFIRKKLKRKVNFPTNHMCIVPFVYYFCQEFAYSIRELKEPFGLGV